MPRTLAIGDIHGCLTALDTLLGFVQPTNEDLLVFLGDYVDRGPDTKGVLDRLIELKKTGRAIFMRGNHEIMMLGAKEGSDDFRFWTNFGGLEALESYVRPGQGTSLEFVPYEHWYFLDHTVPETFETETHIFVHANLHPDRPLPEQSTDSLHWEAISPDVHRPHVSGKTMICGHTEQREGLPLVLEKAVCIDTWAYGEGWLTCLDVERGTFWQANELGTTRKGVLGLREQHFSD
ncbi:MAG: serine/threonine protein phosphatase [Gemmataceae bacterium]|nr:serine/threonine protein phosphatase [Gemmataceae bacterium]